MNCFHYTPGYLSLSRKNLSWHKNNFHSFPHISLLSTLALLKNWGIVFLPAAPRPAFSSNHTPQSVGRKLTTLRERTVRIRKVVGSIPIRSTTKSREIINFTAFLQLFRKNGGPVAQPFPCLFEKMLPNNSQALSTFPFRTSLMACSHIIEKPKNKRSSQKRLIRIQAECT